MAALSRAVTTWDGFRLHLREWGAERPGMPLLCLPGLVRTGADFDDFAERHAGERRVVAIDYLGRGGSERAPDPARYAPEAMLRDVLDACASVHLHRAILVGTSFGGLLGMGIAVMRPGLLAGVVLNDIGPELGAAGEAFIRRFVADDPALPDLAAAATHLRTRLPYLSFTTDAEWRRFATLTYVEGPDGRFHPNWDTRIATLLAGPVRNLWPFFGALAGIPALLVHGARSTLLLAETVAAMQAARPDLAVATIAESGHAPSLAEPVAVAAVDRFIARVDRA
jgi:pimeloyl-ACP methyl ester carboxylesterase